MSDAANLGPGEWVTKEVFLPTGHQFGKSGTPHLDSALTFIKGEKGTLGPTVMRDPVAQQAAKAVDVKLPATIDPKAAIGVAAFALGVITTVVVVKNRHRIKAWWEDKALPRLVAGAMWLLDVEPESLKQASAEVGPISTKEFSAEVEVVVNDLREDMTREEARQRILLILLGASVISENLRKLQDARIADDDLRALKEAMGNLTTAEVVESVNEILSSGHSVLDDEVQALFVKVFGGGRNEDGTYEPLTLDDVRAKLQLPDDDPDAAMASA